VAFNVLAFPYISFDNLGAQVHHHALPKALYQFNIMRVTRRSSSVYQSDNRPSALIVFIFLAQVGPFYVLALVGPSPLLALF
jgi:hypothetical protein